MADRIAVASQAIVSPGKPPSHRSVERRPAMGIGARLARFAAHQPVGAFGGLLVLAVIAAAILAPALAPHDPKGTAFDAYIPPGPQFLFGTDHLGRDVLSRVLWGARLSLYVGLTSVAIGTSVGALWGIAAAWFGGLSDTLSQRVVDSLMGLPPIVFALSLMAVLGQSVENVILALVVLLTPTAARTVRSVALTVQTMPFIEAARAAGCGHGRIVFQHILPNTFSVCIVLFTVNIAYAIVVEAALSFLGLGAPPDEPSWGGMISAGVQALERAPWIAFFPALAISLTVFGLNLLGDAIRDLTDPKLRDGLG